MKEKILNCYKNVKDILLHIFLVIIFYLFLLIFVIDFRSDISYIFIIGIILWLIVCLLSFIKIKTDISKKVIEGKIVEIVDEYCLIFRYVYFKIQYIEDGQIVEVNSSKYYSSGLIPLRNLIINGNYVGKKVFFSKSKRKFKAYIKYIEVPLEGK